MKKHEPQRQAATMTVGDLVLHAMRSTDRDSAMLRRAYVLGLWEDVVGKTMASRTTQIFLKDKKLFVELSSSVARSELLMLRSDIVRCINEKAKTEVVQELILR
ncbi:MAG: DUF721 domain-containing protein [Prevotellaceae bacterium]|jgi:predicted nucleic acid-binding Zn ribbon protein|nr:DUF721 domain-containing protein [Prevotellaceae bacterium]